MLAADSWVARCWQQQLHVTLGTNAAANVANCPYVQERSQPHESAAPYHNTLASSSSKVRHCQVSTAYLDALVSESRQHLLIELLCIFPAAEVSKVRQERDHNSGAAVGLRKEHATHERHSTHIGTAAVLARDRA